MFLIRPFMRTSNQSTTNWAKQTASELFNFGLCRCHIDNIPFRSLLPFLLSSLVSNFACRNISHNSLTGYFPSFVAPLSILTQL